jgi:hypothetical protein
MSRPRSTTGRRDRGQRKRTARVSPLPALFPRRAHTFTIRELEPKPKPEVLVIDSQGDVTSSTLPTLLEFWRSRWTPR